MLFVFIWNILSSMLLSVWQKNNDFVRLWHAYYLKSSYSLIFHIFAFELLSGVYYWLFDMKQLLWMIMKYFFYFLDWLFTWLNLYFISYHFNHCSLYAVCCFTKFFFLYDCGIFNILYPVDMWLVVFTRNNFLLYLWNG